MNKREIIRAAKKLLDPRIKTLSEIMTWVDYLVDEELREYDVTLLLGKLEKKTVLNILNEFLDFIEENGISQQQLSQFSFLLTSNYSTKRGNVLWPLRVAISGKKVALPLFESIEILGYEKTVRRIVYAIHKLEAEV